MPLYLTRHRMSPSRYAPGVPVSRTQRDCAALGRPGRHAEVRIRPNKITYSKAMLRPTHGDVTVSGPDNGWYTFTGTLSEATGDTFPNL